MDVIDTKRLETAILYLQRITEGHNPVNNMPADDDSVMNNPNVIRCMFFVKDVLEKVKKNDGYIGRIPLINRDKTKEEYPFEALANFEYTEDKSISRFVDQLNELADLTKCKKIVYTPIVKWLKENGYLTENKDNNKKTTIPTNKGAELGIYSENRKNARGVPFVQVLYGRQAQKFIVDNMTKILNDE